jgi:hypothetical protein
MHQHDRTTVRGTAFLVRDVEHRSADGLHDASLELRPIR